MAKMTEQEKKEWNELYQYIKKDIFEYDDTFKIPRYMILRLKGLRDGKFMANKKTKSLASYEYNHILYAFKINQMKIKQIVRSDKYKNEQHKFNTIMIIIENEINDVVNRFKNVKESHEKVEKLNLENITHKGAKYQSKNKDEKTNDIFEELW